MLKPVRPVIAALAVTTVLSACGSSKTSASSPSDGASTPTASSAAPSTAGPTTDPTPSADAGLVAMVPESWRKSGTVRVGTDSTYAPSEFLAADGKTVQGFDIDLLTAVLAKFGVRPTYISAPFENLIPGVQSGNYDVSVSSFTINADRLKAVDMVSYFSAGTQWATKPGGLASLDDACGKRIAVQKGTTQVDDLTKRSDDCKKAGKKEITQDPYQGQDQATASVVSGKDDAMSADSPVAAYAVQQTGGKLVTLGDIYGSAPYGYVLKKNQGDLPNAFVTALKALISDGTYQKILDKWGVGGGAITEPKVNQTS